MEFLFFSSLGGGWRGASVARGRVPSIVLFALCSGCEQRKKSWAQTKPEDLTQTQNTMVSAQNPKPKTPVPKTRPNP